MSDRPQPPYLRVAAEFRTLIASGEWEPGSRLPSRDVLGARHSAGENVIRRAQELLITEGLLEGRAGSGTYVRPHERLVMLRFPAATSTPAPAGASTWDAESEAKLPAPAAVAARLGIEEGDHVVRTAYDFLDEARRPVATAISWEPMAITGGTPVVLPDGGPLAGRSVPERMAQLDITVARAHERTRPVQVDTDQAHRLGIAPGALATLIERTFYDTTGRPVETADIIVPAGRWTVDYHLPLT
ncbi:GntR family transcriptional regulator [Streptomyces sp. IBSNAI002]|uniref:GntR family transcriptional regulator n=1 Tax=Streptomyces sp. IBSNAI002 TaxID=3457500 RepID=UPI003FD3CF6E